MKADSTFPGMRTAAGTSGWQLFILLLLLAGVASAQTIQTLCSFNGANGEQPFAGLTLGNDGIFYGTTYQGGTSNKGTVFRVTTNGALTALVCFNGTNGAYPYAALTLGNDGNFYGTTEYGGSTGYGTVFQVTTSGMLTELASFNRTNGARPQAALTLGSDGDFYATTYLFGSVFKVTTNGTLTELASVVYPRAALTLGNDGNFYGTTYGSTAADIPNYRGTVFKVTTNGTLTTLVFFNGTNGKHPQAALTLGSDGNFYGTTYLGGNTTLNDGHGVGTVFKMTSNGALTALVSFNSTNGAYPRAALTLGNDGNFYGTTSDGGSSGKGTVFRVTTNGALTALVCFNGTNGAYPYAALTLGNDGNFYGTTSDGGNGNGGTVFCLLLPPVITVQPQSQTQNFGATVIFPVGATSLQPMLYQWQKNGTNLVDGGNISGATTDLLTITGISQSDAASYSVNVSNANFSVTSSNAALIVIEPFIATQPQSQIVLVGSNVTFTAAAYGAPPLVFQWYFKGAPLGSPIGETNFSTLTLTSVGTNQSGNYSVQVVNGYSSVMSSNATLMVVAVPPTITTQPASRTNKAGTSATFLVTASSVGPLSYQWQKNETNLVNGGTISGATTSTLTIATVSDNDVASYSVTVANLAGGMTSSNATLTVVNPPSITGQPTNQRIVLGDSVSFTVEVNGTVPFRYQWRRGGANISNATNDTYTIQAVGTNHGGNYSVVVTNWAGSVMSSNALLTVIVPPTLALQLWSGYPLLSLNGMLSNNFVVEYSPDLAGTNWTNRFSITNLPFSPYLFFDPAGASQRVRFYRAFMQ